MEDLAYTVTRLVCKNEDGSTSVGTAFFFGIHGDGTTHVPILVTNKHVVSKSIHTSFYLTKSDENGKPILGDYQKVEFRGRTKWIDHPNNDIDLCAATFGDVINLFDKKFNTKIKWSRIMPNLIPSKEQLEKLSTVEDVLMVGYPIGLWDEYNNRPIFRKGITATHVAHSYNGKREFLIDIAAFPGSSGSPVFLYRKGINVVNTAGNRLAGQENVLYLVGVLYAGPMYNAKGEVKVTNVPTDLTNLVSSKIPSNLGIVISADLLIEFENVIPKHTQK